MMSSIPTGPHATSGKYELRFEGVATWHDVLFDCFPMDVDIQMSRHCSHICCAVQALVQAAANAENNHGMQQEHLYVGELQTDNFLV